MNYSNSHYLHKCKNCNALFDTTLKWYCGQFEGTSLTFHPSAKIPSNNCPVCCTEYKKELTSDNS